MTKTYKRSSRSDKLGRTIRTVLLLLLLSLGTAEARASYEEDTEVIQFESYADFKAQVLEGSEIWAIQLYKEEDCGACEMLAPTWRNLAKVLKGMFKVAVMDATTPQGNQFALDYGLDTLPS